MRKRVNENEYKRQKRWYRKSNAQLKRELRYEAEHREAWLK